MAYCDVGTTIIFKKKPPYKEYDIEVGDIGVITYIASTGKYSIHIDGKINPHDDANNENRKYGEQGDFWIPFDCVDQYKFKKDDIVQVVSNNSKFKGEYGTVQSYGGWGYVNVLLDMNGKTIQYEHRSLKLIKNKEYESEEFKMAKLTGFKKVAVIEMSNTNYYYALLMKILM